MLAKALPMATNMKLEMSTNLKLLMAMNLKLARTSHDITYMDLKEAT